MMACASAKSAWLQTPLLFFFNKSTSFKSYSDSLYTHTTAVMSDANTFKIVTIAGDGIGTEVTDAAIVVLETLAKASGSCSFTFEHLDWSSENFLKRGWYMPEDGLESLKKYDAIYFGAVGWPSRSQGNDILIGLDESPA